MRLMNGKTVIDTKEISFHGVPMIRGYCEGHPILWYKESGYAVGCNDSQWKIDDEISLLFTRIGNDLYMVEEL